MDDAPAVRHLERFGQLQAQIDHGLHWYAGPRQPMPERLTFEQLHRNERTAVVIADFVDRADVWMIERRGSPSFAFEAFDHRRVGGKLGRQELQRHQPAKTRVLGLVDDTHSTDAHLIEHAIVGDGLTDHSRRILTFCLEGRALPRALPAARACGP